MADSITLDEVITQLVFETGIDGQTTASGRHPNDTWLAPLVNRCYKELRSLVSHNGEDFFRTSTASTAIPNRESGEDWIALTWPTDAAEVVGIDVQIGGCWYELTKGSWAQRRVFPGANRPESPGEWAVKTMPQPSAATVTTAEIAIWPPTLTGNYKISYLPHWTSVVSGTGNVLVIFPDWLEWLLCKAALSIYQRDNNKKQSLEIVQMRLARAQGQIIAHARRHLRGSVVARRRDGLEL